MVDLRLEEQLAIQAQIDVARIESDIRDERDRISREVGQLLSGGWGGLAAEQYGEGWDDWHGGSTEMLDALKLIGELMGAVRQSIVETDQHASQASTLLISRLGPVP